MSRFFGNTFEREQARHNDDRAVAVTAARINSLIGGAEEPTHAEVDELDYALSVRIIEDLLPRQRGNLHGDFFTGECLPIRLARGFRLLPWIAGVSFTQEETDDAIRSAEGDVGLVVRALLCRPNWNHAGHVERLALLLRLLIEHRRGHALPVIDGDGA